MPAVKRGDLTPADIVLLRLLAERPMHGHEASIELGRMGIAAWAGASRPQVYWSLNKLARMDLIRAVEIADPPTGRRRRVFAATPKSRAALAKTLRRKYWTTEPYHSRFVAWLRLCSGLDRETFAQQLHARKAFLEAELKRGARTTRREPREPRAPSRSPKSDAWAARLSAAHLRAELSWVRSLERAFSRRRGSK
jgi:DNA-binding PadR family transcriptional regulator